MGIRSINRFFLIYYSLVIGSLGLAQNLRYTDSLENKLKELKSNRERSPDSAPQQKDTSIVKTLHMLAKAYWSNDPEIALQYANQSLMLSQKISFTKGIARSYSHLGIINWYKGDYDASLQFHTKALKIQQETNDKQGLANSLNNIGLIHDEQGNYPEALNNYLKALKIREEIEDKDGIANSYNNIGNIHFEQQDYSKALGYYSACLKIRKEMGNKSGIANSYNNIANVYLKQGNYKPALRYHLDALKIREEINDQAGIATSRSNIGQLYERMGSDEQAFKNYFIALSIEEKIGDYSGIANDNSLIGKLFLKKKNLNKAKYHLNKALSVALDFDDLESLVGIYENLSELYMTELNYELSLENYKLFVQCKDSIANYEVSKKILRQQMQYEFDKKAALQQLEQEKKNKIMEANALSDETEKKMYLILGGFLLLTVFALWHRLYYVHKTKKLLEEKNEQIRVEKEISEQRRVATELLDMRQKIARDLHDDIGSSLSSISIYSEVLQNLALEKVPDARKILIHVGEIAQEVMENMNDIVWTINPVNDKLEVIIKRLKLLSEQLKELRNIQVHFDIQENVSNSSLSMQQRKNLYLIMKEGINNMAKYSKASNCHVILKNNEGRLHMIIKDDGKGFDKNLAGLEGNGLINMKERAREINGEFELITEKNKGTEIHLTFEL